MDARPNVLNQILPCTKRTNLHYRYTDGANTEINKVHGIALDPGTDELIYYIGIVPLDFKAGSTFAIVLNCCGLTDNPGGADTHVRLVIRYNHTRAGVVVGSFTDGDAQLVTIVDGEPQYTMQDFTLATISGLAAGDLFGMQVKRDADHTDDDYAADFFIGRIISAVYTADKIGVV